MEHFEIPQTLPAHDALNDAYFTALVAAKLDVEEGIKNYDSHKGELISDGVIGDADAGEDGYVTISELLEDESVASPDCPVCKQKLISKSKLLHSKGQRYSYLFECKNHGNMLLSLKLHRNFNETWRAKRTLSLANDEKVLEFRRSLELHTAKRKMRPRKPRRKPRSVASIEPSTEE